MRMEHTGAGGIIGAPLPAMSCIHIADIEAAINHWRARAPSPDGVGLAPEIEALAEVYGRMVFARAEDVAPQQMPAAALARGPADFVLSLEQLADLLRRVGGGHEG